MSYTDSDLCYITATEAIAAFKNRSLSPVELMQALIKRTEQVNDRLNCLTYEYFERALEQARQAEAIYARDADAARPLEGVPCAIKDWHSVKGEITTYGSKLFRDFRPETSSPTVERLLDAGAIMHCRTTTPEQAHTGVTKSLLWGITRNPWNTEFSPGGSSGGAGAALAAGMTTIADGTDGGGSIRIPASASGVFGYKPPFGRNPTDREHPSEMVLHYGPLTRSVSDAGLMQNVMSGQHPADIHSLREEVIVPPTLGDMTGRRIALSVDLGYFEISDEVEQNTRRAAEVFESLGCTVDEVDLSWDHGIFDAWLANWEGLFWSLAEDMLEQRSDLEPFVATLIERGGTRTVKEFYSVNQVRYEAYQKLVRVFDDHDVLLCPTLAVPSVAADHDSQDDSFTINGKPVHPYLGWALTYPFNLLSPLPVASIPTGFSPSTGVPTGMQIVGHAYDDMSVFTAAAAFESANPWQAHRPAL
jgi:Asp-tRNA(Asn)/Glu-tRNA(Gln) amidotransferase A subunit family amidase